MSRCRASSSRNVRLPFGISITIQADGAGSIEGNLVREFTDEDKPPSVASAKAAADGPESLLLASHEQTSI